MVPTTDNLLLNILLTAHYCLQGFGKYYYYYYYTTAYRYILESACVADVLYYFESGAPWADHQLTSH
eukprot:scaffold8275_cov61-Phaeocystis_antarctica.AAC.11